MKIIIYLLMSAALRQWFERERRKVLSCMVAERIDFDQLRVNIRAK